MTKQTFTEQYLLDVLKNGHQMGILHKQNEDVYNYILERFPIPEDFPYEIYRIGTKLYAFMIENNFNNYCNGRRRRRSY